MRYNQKKFIFPILIILNACAPVAPTRTPVLPGVTSLPTSTLVPTGTSTPEATATELITPTNTLTPTIESTLTFTPEPTYSVPRGVVNQEHVNCYYGPSKAYLYKYGLLKDNRLDIIGYVADTNYIEVQAIGGDNPCWMNLEFMDVQGDINTVKPIDPLTIKLPWSPYYPGLNSAIATREGNMVNISWEPLQLRPGDGSEQEPYLLETWVCQQGELTFVPIGAYTNTASVVDEPGCSEPSFGRVYGVEKHGYTKYLEFDWPLAEDKSD